MQYCLKRFIAAGSFAEVWCAGRVDRNGECVAPDVALKISYLATRHERSRREHDAVLRWVAFPHEGVLRIIDVFSFEGRMQVAMDLAEDSLLGIMRQPVPIFDCLRFVREVAATLDDLHGRGILHGGINPSDVLIHGGRAKLADFGPMPFEDPDVMIPMHKAVCMAPELREMAPSPSADQYSLAATYAWIRLGHDALPKPQRGELPARIDTRLLPERERIVLLTALDEQRDGRFRSCRAFVDALRQACS